MRTVPAISPKGKRLIYALSLLFAGALFLAITLDSNFRQSTYWEYFHGRPLFYLIFGLTGALLAKFGFDKEMQETDEFTTTLVMWLNLIWVAFMFAFILLMFSFAAGAAIYYLASTSVAAAIWTTAICAAFIWLLYITVTKDR